MGRCPIYPLSYWFRHLCSLCCCQGNKTDNEYLASKRRMLADSKIGHKLQNASKEHRNDKQVVLAACENRGRALEYASKKLKDDKNVVLTACKNNGLALQFASEALRDDKDLVLAACNQNGNALEYASGELRRDKEVVMEAATSQPESLKYALRGLNQDRDCLIAAKIWSADREHCKNRIKIVLSTRFALGEKCSTNATQFTVELQKHPYICKGKAGKMFDVYSPNAYAKGTCDPEWTRLDWPCRGTYETCCKPKSPKMGAPQSESRWRYSFRYQQQLALKTEGFMIQVVDYSYKTGHELGNGQSIETEMANEIGLKIFRIRQPTKGVFFGFAIRN